jgi:hypothetical protein
MIELYGVKYAETLEERGKYSGFIEKFPDRVILHNKLFLKVINQYGLLFDCGHKTSFSDVSGSTLPVYDESIPIKEQEELARRFALSEKDCGGYIEFDYTKKDKKGRFLECITSLLKGR